MHSFSQPKDGTFLVTENPESLVKNISDNFISQNKHVDNLKNNIYGAFYPLTYTFELNTDPAKIFLKDNNYILFHIECEQDSVWDIKTAPNTHTDEQIESYLINIADRVGEAMDKFHSKDLNPVPQSSYSHSIGSILKAPQTKQPVAIPANFPQTAAKENGLENKTSAVKEAVDRFNSKPSNPIAPTSYYSKNIGSILRPPQARQSVPTPPNFPKTAEKENRLENKVNAVGEDVKRLNSKPASSVEPYYATSLLPNIPKAPPRTTQPVATTTANLPRVEEKESSLVPKPEVSAENRLYDNSPAVALPQAVSDERIDTILKRLLALEQANRASAMREAIANKRIGALESALQQSLARIEDLESQLKDQQQAQKSAHRLFK